MRTDDRARYENIGEAGDAALMEKTVSIVGLGSVGATIAAMLGREDIGLRLVDKGRVEAEDMHRLSIFYEEDITKFKVKQAKARIAAINPTVQVKSFHEELTENNMFLLKGAALIDASNDDEINRLCLGYALEKKMPLLIIRYGGDKARIGVIQKKVPQKFLEKLSLPSIEEEGIFGPVTVMAGSVVASETLKVLLGESASTLIEIDAWKPAIKSTRI